MNIQQLVTETVQKQLNEAIALNSETANIKNAADILQSIYNRLTKKGISRNEITIAKIAKMVQDLRRMQHYWQNVKMW